MKRLREKQGAVTSFVDVGLRCLRDEKNGEEESDSWTEKREARRDCRAIETHLPEGLELEERRRWGRALEMLIS